MGDEAAKQKARLEKFRRLNDAQKAIQAARVVARKGLNRNPSPEQRRDLDENILDLTERIGILEARILAVRNGGGNDNIAMPSDEQVAETGAILAEVEGLTNQNITAAGALALAIRGANLAREVTA